MNDNQRVNLRGGIFLMLGSSLIAWTVIIIAFKAIGRMCCFW